MSSLPEQNQPPISPVTAAEISGKLQDGNDPLDFILKNLNTAPATLVPRPDGQQVEQPPAKVAEPVIPIEPEIPPLIKEEEKPVAPENELLAEVVKPKKGPEDSIKDLRKKANEFKSQAEEKQTALEQLQQELEKYKTGEVLPDVVKQKEDRIAQLEQYERLHALKLSPEYQKKYVEPLSQLKNQALNLAKDYDVEPDVLNEALEIENKRELNSYLKEHFDDVGTLEARDLILKIKEINKEAQEAEKEPIQAFERIKEQFTREQHASENHRINSIANNAKDGWVEALTELRANGEYPELEITGDSERDKISAPVVQAAAEEFGKLVKLLGAYGVKEFPKDVAKMLAKRFQLSQAAAVTAASRAAHYQRAEDVINTSKRYSSMVRPQVGSGLPNGPAPAQRPQSPKEAADALLNQVLHKR